MNEETKKNPLWIITTFVLLGISIVLAIFLLLNMRKNAAKTASSEIEAETVTLSDEELNSIKEEAKSELLSNMKAEFLKTNGTLGVIKSYYPDNIIYFNNQNQLIFADVIDDLAKNSYKSEGFKTDDDGFITYSEDGAVVSHMGVDASRFQGSIDFSKLKKQGVEFAILRCGFRSYGGGALNKDSSFDTFARNAIQNDIKVGAYFFSSAITKEEAIEEANYVIDIIKPYNITYPVVLDFEEIAGDTYRQENLTVEELTDIIIAFCDTIEKAGYTPMIYSNLKGFVGRMDLSKLEKYEKWFAYYDDTPYFPYAFSIWQYSESGKLDGVSGTAIDLNISFKDYTK